MSALYPIYNQQKLQPQTNTLIISLLEALHELMFSMNFLDKTANKVETDFPTYASKIKKFADENVFIKQLEGGLEDLKLLAKNEGLSLKNIPFTVDADDDFMQNLKIKLSKGNDLGYMFIVYLIYKKDKSNNAVLVFESLEHVLPQNPEKESWPIIAKKKDEELKKSTYSLGNFLVTNGKDNSKYGNLSYEEKRVMYIKDNVYDPSIAHSYTESEEWGFETIAAREKELIELYSSYC